MKQRDYLRDTPRLGASHSSPPSPSPFFGPPAVRDLHPRNAPTRCTSPCVSAHSLWRPTRAGVPAISSAEGHQVSLLYCRTEEGSLAVEELSFCCREGSPPSTLSAEAFLSSASFFSRCYCEPPESDLHPCRSQRRGSSRATPLPSFLRSGPQ